MQRIVRIVVLGDEVEFDFGRHHRLPTAVAVKAHDALQDVTRRVGNFLAFGVDDVADHLRRGVGLPRHDRQRREIRHQLKVVVARFVAEAFGLLRILTRDRMTIDRRGQRQRRIGSEFRGRHHLAARYARKVRRDAFYVFDPARPQPLRRFLPVCHATCRSQTGRHHRCFRDGYGSFQRGLSRGHKTPYLG